MEYNKIIELDNRGYFIDIYTVDYFVEELIEGDVRIKRMLNPNTKTHRELFVKDVKKI